MPTPPRRTPATIFALLALAFAVRVAIRLVSGEAEFLEGSYDFYRQIAAQVLAGHGFCLSAYECALRPPLYPTLLVPFLASGTLYPWLPIVQAAIGAVLVWVTWRTADALFGARAGLFAAALAALSPYAIVHDTAMQETVVVNATLATAVLLLIEWRRSDRLATGLAAGVLLGASVLLTARVAIVAGAAAAWAVAEYVRHPRKAAAAVVIVVLPMSVLVGSWMLRNWRVVGAPVLTTESGASFWFANNRWTFEYLPERSIDLAARRSLTELSPDEQGRLARVSGPVEEDRMLGSFGWTYVAAHPSETGLRAVRKVWVVVSAQLSPRRGWQMDRGYQLVYAAVNVLALAGLWMGRREDGRHRLLVWTIAGFLVTTAIYWAHTSHKSLIDAWLFVYAGRALAGLAERYAPKLVGGTPVDVSSSSSTRSK